jgi:glycosyltransferase involved in cell wall biosynthesis
MYKISIIIPFFNTPKFLFEKCINSIKKQSYTNFECLIINDCSTNEKTVKDAAAMIKMDKRFKMLNNEKNSGCGLSRDHGVLESTGDIITFVDSDDFIEKSYLEYMDNQFSKHEDLDMLILGYKVVFSDGKD